MSLSRAKTQLLKQQDRLRSALALNDLKRKALDAEQASLNKQVDDVNAMIAIADGTALTGDKLEGTEAP